MRRKISQVSEPASGADYLSEAAGKASLPQEAIASVRRWLAELMVADEFAKLGQGGHAKGEVPLRRVFVDLPVRPDPSDPGRRPNFLTHFLAAGPVSLKAACGFEARGEPNSSVNEEPDAASVPTLGKKRMRGRLIGTQAATLLIGGPGQGKSTLGQLACQLHRAMLLLPGKFGLSLREREVLESLSETGGGIGLPHRPLLPIHVALPGLAAWLAKREAPGRGGISSPELLTFVTSLPSAKKNSLSSAVLFDLAVHLPILLVLDGFDEVGATADREGIVQAARGLLETLAIRGASAQVLATTRPQGYAGELEQIGIPLLHQSLALLEPKEAMEYAGRLVEAKISGVDLQKTIMERLTEAASKPATARLLTTPLQVTIITALVQQGRAPKERWRLFWSYFDYTYKREVERETYASSLLSDHRAHIEAIHTRVALLLQVEAERAGGATARMSSEQLRTVVEAVLEEDGIVDQASTDLVADILKAAGERLVFLVEPEPGRFGFEIRSLQEFMAAWALASGPDAQVRSRLLQVAKAPMFRNVLLFVASKLYSDSSHLREMLPDLLCGGLEADSVQTLGRDIGAGAMLALEILEEGAVLNQPRSAAALLGRATLLLDLPAGEHQARLARITADDWGTALRNAIEDHLRLRLLDSGAVLPVGAWICLLESLNIGRPWAHQLASRFPVTGRRTALELIGASDEAGIRVNEWLIEALECSSADVGPPGRLIHYMVQGPLGLTKASSWTDWLARNLSLPITGNHLGYRFPARLVASSRKQSPRTDQEPPSSIPEGWMPLVAAARFYNAPSSETLAAALLQIAEGMSPAEWLELGDISYWPLAACLRSADSPADLHHFANKLRLGVLGNAKDWIAAESEWPANAAHLLILGDDAGAPWSLSLLPQGQPLASIPSWTISHRLSLAKPGITLKEAADAFQLSTSPRRRAMLGELCLALIRKTAARALRHLNIEIEALLKAVPDGLLNLIPRPKVIPLESWLSFLDRFGNEADIVGWPMAPPQELLAACVEANGHPVTLRVALRTLTQYSSRSQYFRTDSHLRVQIQRMLEGISATTQEARAYVAIFQTFTANVAPESESALISDIKALADRESAVWLLFARALAVSGFRRVRLVSLFRLALDAMGPSSQTATLAVGVMRDLLQTETSNLYEKAYWYQFGLPLPAPVGGASSLSVVPEAPVVFTKLDFRDVRGISSLLLPLAKPRSPGGQWTVLLGPNGAGKTTVLRSIALACRNALDPAIWPDDAFRLPWPRVGAEEARIAITLADGSVHESRVGTHTGIRVAQQPEHTRPRLFPLFGYGCRRGSALGGKSREVDLKEDGGPEVATLFSEARDLIHAETWLLILDGDAGRKQEMRSVQEAVVAALLSLLDLEKLTVADRRVWVTERGGRCVLFEALSDGFLTTAGWFLDLVARWIELLTRNGEVIEPDFLSTARGLVLIDELDLHLHPSWQIEAIGRIRRLLPQMSFIVTTHNPLTLVGARPEEIWVLTADGGQVVARPGIEAPMLLTGGQIFLQYFDIKDIYPDSLGRKLQRYGFLSGYAERDDAEEQELIALTSDLSAAALLPDWEVVARTDSRGDRVVTSGRSPRKRSVKVSRSA